MNRARTSGWFSVAVVALAAFGCTPGEGPGSQVPPQPKNGAAHPAEEPIDPASAAKVAELVAKNIEARGGLARLRAIGSLRRTGVIKFAEDDGPIDMAYGEELKRGGKIRVEYTFQGLTGVDAFDGTSGWSTEPFGGRRDAFRNSAEESKEIADQADLDGPLVDWQAKGHRVDYLGTEDIDGTRAHKLKVRLKDGDVEYHYLDPDLFLEIRVERQSIVRGVERISETDVGDYEEVDGVLVPFAFDSGRKGAPKRTHLILDRAEANVALADGLFAFPSAGEKVARVVVPGPTSSNRPATPKAAAESAAPIADGGVISGLGARNIGSAAMSGRIAAVAAHKDGKKTVVYVGSASGGVWKSGDGGTTFKPVFDKQPVQSIGAVTVDPSNPKIVWVGTGEAWTRNSVSIGDGIYRSADGGETWTNMGLKDSERIVKVLVHPKKSEVVFACVPGRLWSDSADRGLYRTTDGGKSWSLVLKGSNLSTGCSGLTFDPSNPDVILAGLWDFRRKGWTSRSGGDGPDAPSASGLYRSADGGSNWTKLDASTNKGLPPGPWGRVEVVYAPSDAKIVYALIESKDSALYYSADGGATWEARDKSQRMVWRPFYFARLVVDPLDSQRLFKPDLGLIVSEDGGKSFAGSGGGSHGDWHDLWIDPTNTSHIIGGDDGGLWISIDGGNRWWKSNNLPVSQFYHVSVDQKDPYQVYGGLQDNSTWVGDSSYPGGITNSRWENLYDSDGFWAVVDPSDPNAVYVEGQGGYIGRVDRRTHAARDIQPKAKYKEKLRFNWNTPIHASPTQKGTIYIGAQFLFRSKDKGDTWERISPDLTTNDPEKQKQEQSGGVTIDNSSAEMHTTIYSISESPKDAKVIWVGTDDGNLQLTRDGGKSWTNVVSHLPGVPKSSWVSWVEAGRFDAGAAFVAVDRHTFGDMTPWVFETRDYGATWKRIAGPEQGVRGYAHVIKQDLVKPDLLFVGTEFGLWISVDHGGRWAEFKGGDFPSVAVRDLQVHGRDHDLVIGTHGRGIWIVDDLTPLRALSSDILGKSAAFLPGRPVQQRMPGKGGWVLGDAEFVGQNAASGAVVTYYQRARHLFGHLKLEVLDSKGQVIDTITPTKRRGINRAIWSMQVKPPKAPRAAQVAYNATQGPRVLPGTYTVRLTKGSETIETKIEIGLDHRAPFNLADRKAQFEASMKVHALFGEMSTLTGRIDAARAGIAARVKALPPGDALVAKLGALDKKIEEAKKKIVATKEGGAITGEERIREHLDLLYGALLSWEGKPGVYQVERIEALRRELADVQKEFDAIVANDVKAVDVELNNKKLGPIPTDEPREAAAPEVNDEVIAAARRCAKTHGAECEVTHVARERD